MSLSASPLASFKLQLADRRARIVPARGLDQCPFEGPGVDLVGEDTEAAFAAAQPLLDWLVAREPNVRVRSISIDLGRGRVLATYTPGGAPDGARPHVLRIDPPLSSEIIDAAAPLVAMLADAAAERLARRQAAQ